MTVKIVNLIDSSKIMLL